MSGQSINHVFFGSKTSAGWREVDGIQSRLEGKVASLYTLYHQVKRSRPPETAEMKGRGKKLVHIIIVCDIY